MLQSGRQYSAKQSSPCPLMYRYHGTEYLGAAHGLCAILQMLLRCGLLSLDLPLSFSFPECLDEKALDEIHRCVDWMVGIQTSTGNWPTTVDEVGGDRGEDDLIHWCHGAPGVIYLMAMAYLKWKDEKYLKVCWSSSRKNGRSKMSLGSSSHNRRSKTSLGVFFSKKNRRSKKIFLST